MPERYTYPGLKPYADKAADDAKLEDYSIRARLGVGPIPEAITTALSQLQDFADREVGMQIPAGNVKDVTERINANLKALDIQTTALKAAVADVTKAVHETMDASPAKHAAKHTADDDEDVKHAKPKPAR